MALLTNLLAYWKLDESSGNVVDVVSGLTLTNINTVTFSPTNAKLGNAANFASASSQRLTSASNATLERGVTDYTWSCWYRPNAVTGGVERDIICKRSDSANRQYTLYQSGTDVSLTAYIGTGNLTVTASSALAANTWALIVAGYDAAQNKRFISINGAAKIYSAAATGTGVLGSTGEFDIGASLDTGTYYNFVDGIIDEVGLWGAVKSDADLADLYNGGAGRTHPFSTSNSLLFGSM